MSSNNKVVLACAADARYALPLTVMLRSAAERLNASRELDIFVVDDGIEREDKRRIESSISLRASVRWVEPKRAGFSGLPLWGRMPVTTYDKIAVADLLPDSVEKVIWLDCDVLVLYDLAELWDEATGEWHAMAAQDTLVPCVSSRFGVAGYRELGLDSNAPYFNAGVMVIDVKRWRRDGVAAHALDYLKQYRERVFFWDQEGLNAVLAGRWGRIDARWNWSASTGRLRAHEGHSRNGNSDTPWAVHFNGNLKPWRIQDGGAFEASYFRTLDETAWTGWRPERTNWNALLGWYGSSWLRAWLYPVEQWGLPLHRQLSRRYTTTGNE